MNHNGSLDGALHLAGLGYSIFPARIEAKPDGGFSKPPQRGVMWSQQSTTEESTLREWWTRWPDAVIGVDCGKSGIMVCDIDPRNGGEIHPWMTENPVVIEYGTLSKGRHLWYRNVDHLGKFGKMPETPGVDYQGHGSYVICWEPERVTIGPEDLPAAPAYIKVLSEKHGAPAKRERDPFEDPQVHDGRWTKSQAIAQLAKEKRKLEEMDHLRMWGGITGVAMVYGRAIAVGIITEDEARREIREACEINGAMAKHGVTNIDRQINNGFRDGPNSKPWVIVEEREEVDTTQVDDASCIVNLDPWLDGTYVPPVPSIGAERDDMVRMLYPGRWHSVIALNTAGKSWFALWHAKYVMLGGGTVAYLHFEESSPAGTLDRLRKMDCNTELIRKHLVWFDCSNRFKPDQFSKALATLVSMPELVILDGINAACGKHGWKSNDIEATGAYRAMFVTPATSVGAAVLSLGHPPKARDRQDERHGFGSTAWLDEVDGVGFRMVASKSSPIRPKRVGSSALYSVKDRYGSVEEHGAMELRGDEAWCYLGSFVLDSEPGHPFTQARLSVPKRDENGKAPDKLDTLASKIEECLKSGTGEFSSGKQLWDMLTAAGVKYRCADVGPALERMFTDGRLQRVTGARGATGGRLQPEEEDALHPREEVVS